MVPPHFFYKIYPSIFQQNVSNCQNTPTAVTLRWRIFPQDISMGQMCMTDAGMSQDYFILPAPPVGLGKNILVNMLFKISIPYTSLDVRHKATD